MTTIFLFIAPGCGMTLETYGWFYFSWFILDGSIL